MVSGAKAEITLANGTRLSRITGADSAITILEIPLDTFGATFTNLGASTQINGDASSQKIIGAKVEISYPTIVVLVALITLAVGP